MSSFFFLRGSGFVVEVERGFFFKGSFIGGFGFGFGDLFFSFSLVDFCFYFFRFVCSSEIYFGESCLIDSSGYKTFIIY